MFFDVSLAGFLRRHRSTLTLHVTNSYLQLSVHSYDACTSNMKHLFQRPILTWMLPCFSWKHFIEQSLTASPADVCIYSLQNISRMRSECGTSVVLSIKNGEAFSLNLDFLWFPTDQRVFVMYVLRIRVSRIEWSIIASKVVKVCLLVGNVLSTRV